MTDGWVADEHWEAAAHLSVPRGAAEINGRRVLLAGSGAAHSPVHEPEDFLGSRARWLAGKCPCCGSALPHGLGVNGAEAQAVAEGVWLCGHCIENEHHLEPGFLPILLEALLPGYDEKVRGSAAS